jgi:hypothetical protein
MNLQQPQEIVAHAIAKGWLVPPKRVMDFGLEKLRKSARESMRRIRAQRTGKHMTPEQYFNFIEREEVSIQYRSWGTPQRWIVVSSFGGGITSKPNLRDALTKLQQITREMKRKQKERK